MGELTAGLLGHSHPVIREAVLSTFDNVGLSLGSTTVQEHKYAALLCDRFKVDRIRFTNTGTEANMHALAGARHFTGRRRVVVFSGGYHGAVFSFAGGTSAVNNVDRDDFVIAAYNDAEGACKTIASTPDLAAVLVEPMQGGGGCIPGTPEFLRRIQDAAHAAGALFILDEVMTSRLGPHGLGHELGLQPDLKVFGKYLGGGFAFGAFGGRAEVMAVYDPRVAGALAHSGTFNNNTMAMHAGYAALTKVLTPARILALNSQGDALRETLARVAQGTRLSVTGRGSMIALHFTADGTREILRAEDAPDQADLRDLFWFEMLEEGYWTTRRGMIALMLDTPDEELARFVDCVGKFLDRHGDIMKL